MPKVSIVVPVYNVEQYLALSLESLRRQTLRDIEIICVNDGSTDSSREMLGHFARVDSRIAVIDKENGGVSSARNVGISAAKGDIVCTFDPDDLMKDSACETIVKAFGSTKAQVVTFGAYSYPELDQSEWLKSVLNPRFAIYDPFDARLLFDEQSSPYAWRTACKREFLAETGVRFEESLPCGEDLAFQFALYPRSSRTALIPDKLIRYRVSRKGSAMAVRLSDPTKMACDHISIVGRVFDDWKTIDLLGSIDYDALDWAADFVMIRVFQLDERDGEPLLDPLRDVLVRSFDDAILRSYVEEGKAGGFVNALVYDRSLAKGNSRRRITYEYLARVRGRRFVVRSLFNRAKWSGPWKGAFKAVGERVHSADRFDKKAKWDAWEREDELLRKEAIASLKREYEARE